MEDEIKMPDEDVLIDLAELFKIFGDSTRVKILFCLHDGEKSVGEVASLLGMTDSAISHQLKILKDSKLVRGRRDGKQIYYSLDDGHVLSILNQGIEHVCE
ncbi:MULTISPECIES: ArsR/SmtB family transcription factor [unclassified Treponema]|uniref:ArsR/SmtB family transcription factor n=1 Tax=unclassified Treponema TaxID=2638727 RepID=UPI0025D87AA6|nr:MULTISPECIES: metalloregulator ArsR/SmtB family transcription factor [unclassified Treponema]